MKSLKVQIIFIAAVMISLVSVVVTGYTIVYEKKQSQNRLAQAHKSVTTTYNESINELVRFFHARAECLVADNSIRQAFKEKNHDALYLLTKEKWAALQSENPHLIVFQFHNSDGTSLLRVHQPSVYGDDIAKLRTILQDVHTHKRLYYGFEEGRGGFAFRVVSPVFYENEYLGAVEFGVSAENLAQLIKHTTDFDAVFFAHNTLIGKFQRVENDIAIGDFVSLNMPKPLSAIMESYKRSFKNLENNFVEYENHLYYLTTSKIQNHKGETIGLLAFLNQMDDFNAYIKSITFASFLITLSIIVLAGSFINVLYNKISNKMHFQELFNQTILDTLPSPVIATDGKELILANQTFLHYFQYKSVNTFKKEHNCICDFFEEGDTSEFLLPKMNDQVWTAYIFENPHINHKVKITLNEKTTVFDVKLSALEHKGQSRYVVAFTDISSLQTLSINDSLTGIANRLHFNMVFEHLVSIAKRQKSDLGIIFFDIDHFKKVNDIHGHSAGDTILKSISHIIKEKMRKSDIFARWGGEEFVLLLPQTSLQSAKVIAEGMRLMVANEEFAQGLKITCSFGVAVLRENESSHELIKRVDSLLYEAKELGRNQVSS